MKKIEHKFINNVEHKYCSGCKKYYVLSEFIRDPKSWDKLYYQCPDCRKKARNQDAIKKANKLKWQKKKQIKNYSKIQYAEYDKEKLYLRTKRSREKYKEHLKSKDQKWLQKNIKHVNERNKKYREEKKRRIIGYVTVCDKCGKQCEFGSKTKRGKAYYPSPQERYVNRSVVLCSSCYELLLKCETRNEKYLFWKAEKR